MERTPKLVLVVDDEIEVTELLRMVLESEGHEVVVASDGQAALDRVAERRPDLVVLDIDMPQISGLRSAGDSRICPGTRMIPILLLTGAVANSRMRGWELGADEFLTKPFQPLEIAARCRSLLRQKDLVDALDSAESVVFALVRAIEAKSPFTHGHSERVTRYALVLAERLGLGEAEIDILRRSAILHDIGKISTPDLLRISSGVLILPISWRTAPAAKDVDLGLAKSEPFRQHQGVPRHPARMSVGVRGFPLQWRGPGEHDGFRRVQRIHQILLAQQGAAAGGNLQRLERLGQELVGPKLPGPHAVAGRGSGQHQDRNHARVRGALELPADLEAAHCGMSMSRITRSGTR